MTCDCCSKKPENIEEAKEENNPKVDCLSCFKKQNKEREAPPARINFETETKKGTKWTDRLKCCGKRKVGDSTTCFSLGKRKDNWAERRNSILNPNIPKIRYVSTLMLQDIFIGMQTLALYKKLVPLT